jgi:3-dehydroquinate synthase
MDNSMLTVEVALNDRSYPVIIGTGLLGRQNLWQRLLAGRKALVVSNEIVAPLYLDQVLDAFPPGNRHSLVLPDGESGKNILNWSRIIDELVDMKAGRDACVIGLGGGVIGDISGYAASSYMRGIDFIQAPTSLLAQVDASVGGKTAVNHEQGKNLIGAFHQPRAVLVDIDTLDTLPDREYQAGLAEVVKYGAISDPSFFKWLENRIEPILNRDRDTVSGLIDRSVRNKAEVVAEDEHEAGVRALLNFGHSFGHALETLTAYRRYLHGEAVAIGMVVAATLSEARGVCVPGVAGRLGSLLSAFRLPVEVPAGISSAAIIECLKLDKKALHGKTRLVLLNGPGSAYVDDLSTTEEIAEAIEACRQ